MTLYIGNRKVLHTVRVGEVNNQNLSVTENGTYNADASLGYTGLGTVTVDIPTDPLGLVHSGTIDAQGAYTSPYNSVYTGTISFDGVVSVAEDRAFSNMLSRGYDYYDSRPCRSINGTIIFPDLVSVTGQEAFQQFCYQQQSLTAVSFPVLSVLTGSYAFQGAFGYCSSLANVSFGGFTTSTISNGAIQNMEYMLESVENCTVHFPANLDGMFSYDDYFLGGSNITVAFDLPATT